MKVTFEIHYVAGNSEELCLVSCNDGKRWTMKRGDGGWWHVTVDVKRAFAYRYCCVQPNVVRWEEGEAHNLVLHQGCNRLRFVDAWHEVDEQNCYTEPVATSLVPEDRVEVEPKPGFALLMLRANGIEPGRQLAVCGDNGYLGYWQPDDALSMTSAGNGLWVAQFPLHQGEKVEYKFVLRNLKTGVILWERGENRIVCGSLTACEATVVRDMLLRLEL